MRTNLLLSKIAFMIGFILTVSSASGQIGQIRNSLTSISYSNTNYSNSNKSYFKFKLPENSKKKINGSIKIENNKDDLYLNPTSQKQLDIYKKNIQKASK